MTRPSDSQTPVSLKTHKTPHSSKTHKSPSGLAVDTPVGLSADVPVGVAADAPFGVAVNRAIAAAAAASPQAEICGVVRRRKDGWRFCQLRNQAADSRAQFRIEPARLLALGPVAAIVHSHPDGPAFPSLTDQRQQQASALIWGICVPPSQPHAGLFWFGDAILHPLAARPYRHAVTDCYALVRDWYRANFGLTLINPPRRWQWWHQGTDLYSDQFRAAGFHRLADAAPRQRGDVALVALLSPVPNHALIDLGDGLVLHHLAGRHGFDPGRLPRAEPVERWRRHIRFWVRHNTQDGSQNPDHPDHPENPDHPQTHHHFKTGKE